MATTLADRSPLPRRLTTRRKKRRGLVLLMVVSLLALFLLMGVTFAILAIQYKTAASVQARHGEYGDPPMQEMELAVGQLLYGSGTRSAIEGHELLRDFYGKDYVQGVVTGVTPASNAGNADDHAKTSANQFQVFTFTGTGSVSQAPGFYNGRVITFITGNAAGFSTRIAGYSPGSAELYVETIRTNSTNIVTLSNNDQFVINGQPMNGMGFGYDPYALRIEAVDSYTSQAIALMPHYAGYRNRYATSTTSPGSQFAPDAGGADEPFDVPDLNNLAMAMVPPAYFVQTGMPLLPSFHRPELVNYWLAHWPSGGSPTLKSDSAQRDFIRQVIFRPMPWDHPNFTGGNPSLSTANTDADCLALLRLMAQQGGWNPAVWDVDNDGDGVRDSVWVDIGLPVVTSPTGRRYKRLFAFLVKDLDGRINLNVHGNWQQQVNTNQTTTPLMYPFPAFGGTSQPNVNFPMGYQGGFGSSQLMFPRGLGFGPAEVDVQQVIGVGNISALLNARYASSAGGDFYPGLTNTDDPLSVVKFSGIPANYYTAPSPPMQFPDGGSWYASPPDVWGRGAVAVDFGGKPVHFRMGNANETRDDPYEMEWDPQASQNDSPFTAGDMEVVLRANDHDMQYFPSRIGTALPGLTVGAGSPSSNGAAHRLRESVTMMSHSVPSPPAIPSYEERTQMRAALQSSLGVSQAVASERMTDAAYAPSPHNLFAQRLINGGVTAANVPNEMAKMFPIEFWQGSKLNINRFLGNGINDNNAVDSFRRLVDEPAESQTFAPLETAWGDGSTNPPSGGALPAGFGGQRAFPVNSVDVDPNNPVDSPATPSQDIQYARHLLARHLFCLMMAVKDRAFNAPQLQTNGPPPATEAMSRQIAQWAINVVDFRDSDAIMTHFEYDMNPWNGWSVDGNLATNEMGDRRVVWGCEYPELLVKEAVAFHDRRVKDTDQDDHPQPRGGKTRAAAMRNDSDPNMDQYRVPQGSLFFEMFNTRTHAQFNSAAGSEAMYNPQLPWELYDRNSGRLDLARTTSGGSPVWQVAISSIVADPQALPHSRIQSGQWDSTLYTEPTNPAITGQTTVDLYSDVNVLTGGPGTPTVDIERYVWFTSNDGGAANPKRNRIFYNEKNWNAQVAPGQYVVVGPRQTTYMGSQRPGGPGPAIGQWNNNSQQKIDLSSTGISYTDRANAPPIYVPGTSAQPIVGIVADTRPPDAWSQAALPNRRVGLNITEPLTQSANYYREYNSAADARVPFDAYHDPNVGGNTLPDEPFDSQPNRPLQQASMVRTGTYRNKSALFLQRLADPTRDWEPTYNPYIVVDFASIDVTVFNGEDDTATQVTIQGAMEDKDPSDPAVRTEFMEFGAAQRGTANNVARGNPWFPFFDNLATDNVREHNMPAGSTYLRADLRHTLGYINENVGTPRSDKGQPYLGDPTDTDKPFPWLTWNNRPFSNAAELLLVPMSPASRLMLDMSPDHPAINAATSPYQATAPENYRAPFGHLLNFLHSSNTPGAGANYAGFLDYVEVPSPFVGAERWYSPPAVTVNGNPTYNPAVPPFLYRPPFNRLSRFRDPGRININTITDTSIWAAVNGYDGTSQMTGMRASAADVFLSRQGYGTLGAMDSNYPTLFGNPFRPAGAADLVPLPSMRIDPSEATLLRSGGPANKPLLANRGPANAATRNPDDPDRNAYFRYQGLQKITNIVGTQSNCYGAWVTVGYFEVEDSATGVDAAHPDGFQLGQELGMDTGNAQRHRSFFLIDRSIPAGFIPGLKLNTDNCVLLKRQID